MITCLIGAIDTKPPLDRLAIYQDVSKMDEGIGVALLATSIPWPGNPPCFYIIHITNYFILPRMNTMDQPSPSKTVVAAHH